MNPLKRFDRFDLAAIPDKCVNMGIALRIALMAWLVALTTVIVFALLAIPHQKKVFSWNLESKAKSVVVSLHDKIAGAAINEDYASVVTAGQAMLAGDPELDFLIVMKNDGFSLIMEQGSWRVEHDVQGGLRPHNRESISRIEAVPLFNRRVFHYAQPFNYPNFDYPGFAWGWIHVGLSLKKYDQSVASLYLNSVLLTLGCIALSLVVSLIYAGKLVQPILRLRRLVEQIAGGDLSVRTDVTRRDELGSLAESVNAMTEALLRRDRILESVRFAAQKFMQTCQWEDTISPVLGKIGQAAGVDRAYLFENYINDNGCLCPSKRYEWLGRGGDLPLTHPDLQKFSYIDVGLDRWMAMLGNNEIISGPVSRMHPDERAVFEARGIESLMVIPIFVEGDWWGFLGLDDCARDREWTDPEKDSLRAGADMLGATIARQRIQEALMESKATLELRVQERTRELEKQVAAKEQALNKLAEVQSSLLEMSRAAGRAEVATGVLHNVGNVLNSVNVSCTLIMDQLRESRVGNVARVAGLMVESGNDPGQFFGEDPRGRQIPAYLTALAAVLEEEHQHLFKESEALHGWVEHIKEIVTMQQTYGGGLGVLETMVPDQLLEDALTLNAGELTCHDITVERQFQPVPPITVDKHKVLQILLNLISNAKHACTDGGGSDKKITLRMFSTDNDRLTIQVSDNGKGILPENLIKIFQYGFTTRRSGHGFGLHSGALAANELGGSLTVHSDGPDLGATFSLELPCHPGDRI